MTYTFLKIKGRRYCKIRYCKSNLFVHKNQNKELNNIVLVQEFLPLLFLGIYLKINPFISNLSIQSNFSYKIFSKSYNIVVSFLEDLLQGFTQISYQNIKTNLSRLYHSSLMFVHSEKQYLCIYNKREWNGLSVFNNLSTITTSKLLIANYIHI